MKSKNPLIDVASELNSGEIYSPGNKKSNSWAHEAEEAKRKSAKNPVKIFTKEEIEEYKRKRESK